MGYPRRRGRSHGAPSGSSLAIREIEFRKRARVQFGAILEPIASLGDCFDRAANPQENTMSYARLALLSTAVSLTLVASPVLAQTSNEAGGYNNGGWNNGIPVVGPVFGLMTAPFTVATGGWAQPSPGCRVDRDFNGRYTSICGM
jgi:hypothetical protein